MLIDEFLCKREVLGKSAPHSFTPPPPLSVVGVSNIIIEEFHHTSVVRERICTKLFEFQQNLLPYAYKSLFLVYLKALRLLYICSLFSYFGEHYLHSLDANSNPWILWMI
jgi:hypothetical protein